MPYGYAEYTKIMRLLDKFNIVLNDKSYEKFVAELTEILNI